MLGSSPAGITKWPLGLMVRTGLRFTSVGAGQQSTGLFAPSQATNDEFKSHRGHLWVGRIVAIAADCKSAELRFYVSSSLTLPILYHFCISFISVFL